MQTIADHWQVVATIIGGIIAAIIGAWAKTYFEKRAKLKTVANNTGQTIRSGSRSVNVQAQRDANVGTLPKN